MNHRGAEGTEGSHDIGETAASIPVAWTPGAAGCWRCARIADRLALRTDEARTKLERLYPEFNS
jgi:hypothetical protein